jgi:microcystin degradation protein MlrC
MAAKPRIAVGGILTECNHLGGLPIDISWFERYELRFGSDVLKIDSGVVGGMLEVLDKREAEAAPLLFASTCPGGHLTSECYGQLKLDLLDRLAASLPVKGVLLPLHGAMVAERVDDPEGDLIRSVRKVVGSDVPIMVTLDLHAQVTDEMVSFADALVAWETYPHADSYSTGQRGARLILDAVEGKCHPTMVAATVPVVTGGIHGSTEDDSPFAQMMQHTKALEKQDGVLSTSLFLGHPYLDMAQMGSGAVVITDNDVDGARALAAEIAQMYWNRRFELEPNVMTPCEAIAAGLEVDGGPVLLVETADCCGGGAAGDSVATLKALLETAPNASSLVPVVDAEAAAACHAAGEGSLLTLVLGHKHDPVWGEPVTVSGTVVRLGDGRFRYEGGIWDGVDGNMGATAVFRIGSIEVMITTHATYDWKDEQFCSMECDPSSCKFIVAKNPMNYRVAYGDIAKAIFILNTTGPTPATIKHVSLSKIEHPYFPAVEDIPGLVPRFALGYGL